MYFLVRYYAVGILCDCGVTFTHKKPIRTAGKPIRTVGHAFSFDRVKDAAEHFIALEIVNLFIAPFRQI